MSVSLRDCTPADIPAIAAIYAHWVTTGLASFELSPPGVEEMQTRREAVLAAGGGHGHKVFKSALCVSSPAPTSPTSASSPSHTRTTSQRKAEL
jgi:hypothetical protein